MTKHVLALGMAWRKWREWKYGDKFTATLYEPWKIHGWASSPDSLHEWRKGKWDYWHCAFRFVAHFISLSVFSCLAYWKLIWRERGREREKEGGYIKYEIKSTERKLRCAIYMCWFPIGNVIILPCKHTNKSKIKTKNIGRGKRQVRMDLVHSERWP